MRPIRTLAVLGIVAVAGALAAPAARAFTMENKDAAGQYGVPKFDLEEQAKNFSKSGGVDTSVNSDGKMSVPFAGGTLNFGVQSGSNFGPGPGFLGPMTRDTRQDFNRNMKSH